MNQRRAFLANLTANVEFPVKLGSGYTSLSLIPQTLAVDLQFGFEPGLSNQIGKYAIAEDGRAVTFDGLWDGQEAAEVFLFATGALTVSVVAWRDVRRL